MLSQFNTIETKVKALFQQFLPNTIKCVDNKQYANALSLKKEHALHHEMIQFNPVNSVNMIMLDIDHGVDPFATYPPPNCITANKSNGRAHIAFFLENPVHANTNSSKTSQGYYSSIHKALITANDADPKFNHFFTKSPFHAKYRFTAFHDRLYSLDHLADWVKPINKTITKPEDSIALGRNCYIFDSIRKIAYLEYKKYQDYKSFFERVLHLTDSLNLTLPCPLNVNEINDIAKSISTWTWNKFSPSAFSKIQSFRGKQSGISRQENMMINKQKAIALLGQGLKVSEIAKELNLSKDTIWLYLSNYNNKPNEPYQDRSSSAAQFLNNITS